MQPHRRQRSLLRQPADAERFWVVARQPSDGPARIIPQAGGLAVSGLDADAIGDLASAHGIALHELTPRHASLEEAFMELTRDSVDYHADVPDYAGKAA